MKLYGLFIGISSMNIMKESDKKILKKDYYDMIEKYIQTILF